MHVHRTTLYYRMERIQQLTGVDIRRGDDSVHLQLALWLDAYRSVTIGVGS
ncbi:helix-turn-helix domain-containing protein [Microlunatus phosphovorus]|uniref:helix-turn-helix domain-containing protein n=1 Tax=Microlunatus phosphovorus TaxID=29405 RepID=UPI000A02B479